MKKMFLILILILANFNVLFSAESISDSEKYITRLSKDSMKLYHFVCESKIKDAEELLLIFL